MTFPFRGSKTDTREAVISLDSLSKTIQFCTANDSGSDLFISLANYKDKAYDKEFLDRLGRTVRSQLEKNSESDFQRASLILPDRLFLLDTVSIPVIHRKAMQQSLNLAIEAVYKNASELNIKTYSVQQNKQSATYGIVGIRKDLVESLTKTFADNGVTLSGVTFASNAMVNGAMALNAKLRGESFLLMDIKSEYTRMALVVRGITMGYYDLPFGYSSVYKSRLAAEDTLFDHQAGELMVLNAKERARAKQLTMAGEASQEAGTDSEDGGEGDEGTEGVSGKSGRKLPKFMQRPIPRAKEDFMYENFRVFAKWALELMTNNREIVSLSKQETIYVNMPQEYAFLLDVLNQKHAGRGHTFQMLVTEDSESTTVENLELYGGFFLTKYNETNTFEIKRPNTFEIKR